VAHVYTFLQTLKFVLVQIEKLFAKFEDNYFCDGGDVEVKELILLQYFKLPERISLLQNIELIILSTDTDFNRSGSIYDKVNMVNWFIFSDDKLSWKDYNLIHVILNDVVKHSNVFLIIGMIFQIINGF
jgi:hypothetical protein